MSHLRKLIRPLRATPIRLLSTAPSTPRRRVSLVEVGPRDGLQNEKAVLPTQLKVDLIEKLVEAGLDTVEVGSLVSTKFVPQMASTPEVLAHPSLSALRHSSPSLSLPVLIPTTKFLSQLLDHPAMLSSPPISDTISVFLSASEAFSRANLGCSVADSVKRVAPVVEDALRAGLRVRGYVSVVLGCPFEGRVPVEQVESVARELLGMGCYEVSLGDTIGVGTPDGWEGLMERLRGTVGVERMAIHAHDTYGAAVANVLRAVSLGIPTVDSSIAALGGCPYSPGATGNVATEDVVYALESSGVSTGVLPLPAEGARWDDLLEPGPRGDAFRRLSGVGEWISKELGRENGSKAGRAVGRLWERRERKKVKEGEKAKL